VSRTSWSRRQRWKNDAIFFAAAAAVELGLVLPRSWLPRIGSLIGEAAHALLSGARRTTHQNLALVRPELDDSARRALTRAIFRSLGRNLTDTVALLDPTEEPDRTLGITTESREALESALGEGRGVIYATCHLGPWERMAALLAKLGYPITTVARESYDPRFHGLLYERLRTSRNVEAIYRTDPSAPFAIVRALRRGRVVGFLVDLPSKMAARTDGARNQRPFQPVEWLGCPSHIALGPARLALRIGSPIVIGTPAPAAPGDGNLCVRIARLPGSDVPAGPAGEAVLCQRIADALSERIRTLEAHWPWMHPSFGPVSAVDPERSARHFRLVHWERGDFL
jgi:Kdo2-lipid IVA lauroyltransferase/acyltransferase